MNNQKRMSFWCSGANRFGEVQLTFVSVLEYLFMKMTTTWTSTARNKTTVYAIPFMIKQRDSVQNVFRQGCPAPHTRGDTLPAGAYSWRASPCTCATCASSRRVHST